MAQHREVERNVVADHDASGNHLVQRLVDAGEGLVLGVFEQAGRANGQRGGHPLEVGAQIGARGLGQPRRLKALGDPGVVGFLEREVAQVVLVEELLEDIDDGKIGVF